MTKMNRVMKSLVIGEKAYLGRLDISPEQNEVEQNLTYLTDTIAELIIRGNQSYSTQTPEERRDRANLIQLLQDELLPKQPLRENVEGTSVTRYHPNSDMILEQKTLGQDGSTHTITYDKRGVQKGYKITVAPKEAI